MTSGRRGFPRSGSRMARTTISTRIAGGALEVVASPSTTPPSSPAWTTNNTSGRSPLRARSATDTSSARRPTSQISPLLNGNDSACAGRAFFTCHVSIPSVPWYSLCQTLGIYDNHNYVSTHVDASMDRSPCQIASPTRVVLCCPQRCKTFLRILPSPGIPTLGKRLNTTMV